MPIQSKARNRATALAGALMATLFLAAALPASAQDTRPGAIMVSSGYSADKPTDTADFYIVNNSRRAVGLDVDPAWIFPPNFPQYILQGSIEPWGVLASMGVDLSPHQAALNHPFTVTMGLPQSGSVAIKIAYWNFSNKNEIDWQIQDATTGGGGWMIAGTQTPSFSGLSGACAYTTNNSTAIFNDYYAVTLTKAYGGDKLNTKVRSKVILMISEIVPSGQATYKNCQVFW